MISAAAAAAATVPAAASADPHDDELVYLLGRYETQRQIYERFFAAIPDPPDGRWRIEFDERTRAASEKLRRLEWAIMSMHMTTLERVQAFGRVALFQDRRFGSTEAAQYFARRVSGEYDEPAGLIRGAEGLALIESDEEPET